MSIADIYLRVSTPQQVQGDGFRRQEDTCREWCDKNGFVVRNIIKDICSAYKLRNLAKGNIGKKYDSWRKYYWEQKGEPLEAWECPLSVIPEIPPDMLVVESMDRFSRGKSLEVCLTLSIWGSMNIRVASAWNNMVITDVVREHFGKR